jgi:hypothetical protein
MIISNNATFPFFRPPFFHFHTFIITSVNTYVTLSIQLYNSQIPQLSQPASLKPNTTI